MLRNLTKIFKALSDQNRIRIIKMLQVKPLCVCEITDILDLAPSTVSKHLSILRDAELILDEKEGRWVIYRLNDDCDKTVVGDLIPLLRQWVPDYKMIKQDEEAAKEVSKELICCPKQA